MSVHTRHYPFQQLPGWRCTPINSQQGACAKADARLCTAVGAEPMFSAQQGAMLVQSAKIGVSTEKWQCMCCAGTLFNKHVSNFRTLVCLLYCLICDLFWRHNAGQSVADVHVQDSIIGCNGQVPRPGCVDSIHRYVWLFKMSFQWHLAHSTIKIPLHSTF